MSDSNSKDRPLVSYLWQLGKAILAFISVIIYSRYLGAEGRGQLSVYLLYVQSFLMVNELFVGSALANWIANYGLRRFLPRIIGVSLLMLLLAYFLSLFFSWDIKWHSPHISALLLSWAAILIIQNVALNYFQSSGEVIEKIRWLLLFEAMKVMAMVAMILGVLGIAGCSFFPVMNVLLVLNFVGWIWVLLVIVRMLKLHAFAKHAENSDIRHTWYEGIWAQLGQILLFLIYRTPVFLAQYYINDAAAGILANVLLVIDTLWIFSNTLGTIVHSRALQRVSKFRKEKICLRFETISFLGTSFFCVGIMLIPSQLYMWVFGAEFGAMAGLLRISIPGILALSLFAPLGNLFHAYNQFKKLFLHHLLGFLGMITCSLIWMNFDKSVTFTPLIWTWNLALIGVMLLHFIRRNFEFKNHPNMIFNVLLIWRLIRIKSQFFGRR